MVAMIVWKMRVLGGPLLLLVSSALAAVQFQNETQHTLLRGTHRQLPPMQRGREAPIIIPGGQTENITTDTGKIQMRGRVSIPQGFVRSQEVGSLATVQFTADEPMHTMKIRDKITQDGRSVALYGEEFDDNGSVVSTITLIEKSYGDKVRTTGSFWNKNDLYQVSFDAEGNEVVLKQNVDQFVDEENPDDDHLDDSERRMLEEDPSSWSRELQYQDDPGTIDIMVIYTKATMCTTAFKRKTTDCPVNTANQRPIEALIDLAVLESNLAYTNSKIPAQFRLVHTHMDPDFSEHGKDIDDILRNMKNNNGDFFKYIEPMRESVGADFVVLLIEDSPYW
jgi:hypothetical protein